MGMSGSASFQRVRKAILQSAVILDVAELPSKNQ
jgi:hypothetical protein